ncbi:septum formation initiator family protein [Streptomyces sp. NPDC004783]|uniref:septum formation initiator family protein n=1 Tax=Streptomyces sp. NPDC004783 TaxID=3154459 RepID=UPI0033B6EE55
MSRKPELKGRAARLARLLPPGGGRGQAARAPFVLLVVLLLGGGLIGLLVLNSALSEGSFELEDLKQETKSLTDEEQALQRDIDTYSAPQALQHRARELGMVPGTDPVFLAPDGTVKGSPRPASAAAGSPRPASAGTVPLVLVPEALGEPAAPVTPGTATPGTGANGPAATVSAGPTGPTSPTGPTGPAATASAGTGPTAPPASTAAATPTPTPGR